MAPVQMPNGERVAYRDAYLTIDFSRHAVMLESRPIELTSKEYAMLAFLAGHAGEILPREALLAAVWGYNDQVRTRTLDVQPDIRRVGQQHLQPVTLESVRAKVRQSETPRAQGGSASLDRVGQWLAEREARGGIWTVKQERVANRTTHFVIYAGDQPKENQKGQDIGPAEEAAQIQKRIDFIVEGMARAIANHEFEKARFYSDEERKEQESAFAARAVQLGGATAASPAPVHRHHS
jgi:Transcriptional regulatory protein, C terminal